MTHEITINVIQRWRVTVEAGNRTEAELKAIEAYNDSTNPWDDECLIDDGEAIVEIVR